MGFSPLANMSKRIPHGNRQSKRKSKITGFTIHHNAGVDSYGEATNPRREVSAHYWITNSGEILPQIDETMRAWTTGHAKYPAGAASDHRNVTVEVSNSPEGVRNGTWAISDAARNSLEKLIADVFRRNNLGQVRRGKEAGVAVHRDFVSTSCPGPWVMERLNSIIANAERIRNGSASRPPKPTPPTTSPGLPSTGNSDKSINEMAREVIEGRHGTGHLNRRKSLKVSSEVYEKVRAEVNRILGIKTVAAAPTFPTGIGPGRNKPSAVTLQRQLKRAGFMPSSVKENANYGPQTRAAVARFHNKHLQFRARGKDYDPAIGPKGWKFLFEKY